MSTSIILLDQSFNANDVDIMVFEPSVLFPLAAVWGEIDDMVPIPISFRHNKNWESFCRSKRMNYRWLPTVRRQLKSGEISIIFQQF